MFTIRVRQNKRKVMVLPLVKISKLLLLFVVIAASHTVVFAETEVNALNEVISISDLNNQSDINDDDSKLILFSEDFDDLICPLTVQNLSIHYVYSSNVYRNLAIRAPPTFYL
jgi:hypothetical protein